MPRGSSSAMPQSNNLALTVAVHFLCLCAVGVPILVLFLVGKPFKRGFFCDDESLRYPFRDSTVTSPMLYSYGILIPIIVMTVLEGMRAMLRVHETIATSKKLLYKWKVPSSLQVLYMLVGVFLMGAAISQLLTDIAKYTIGRLRPHFFDLCQPVNLKVLCAKPYTYVENFTCGSNATEHQLKEMRLSFMSGHSSFSAYTMMYTVLYIHARMPWRNSVAMAARTVVQVALLSLAWYTALSRVSNYKHHWSDVLAGSAEGYLVAIVVVFCCLPPACRQRAPLAGQIPLPGSNVTRHELANLKGVKHV
ncbi:putative phosphatidate phosphatase isoform X3 [Dermacentor andersoni]|uniref:putative phosphatidate phosphatase isoform X3 n=1 Tax=Dermacentor andersoni TaxID=34620 RepID=UPI003B3A338A